MSRETANLHALIVTFTFPLTKLFNIRPHLWESVEKCMMDRGLWNKNHKIEEVHKPKLVVSKPSTKIRVQINNAGGKVKGDEGNTTLHVMINKVESIAILDSGSRVGISTKKI